MTTQTSLERLLLVCLGRSDKDFCEELRNPSSQAALLAKTISPKEIDIGPLDLEEERRWDDQLHDVHRLRIVLNGFMGYVEELKKTAQNDKLLEETRDAYKEFRGRFGEECPLTLIVRDLLAYALRDVGGGLKEALEHRKEIVKIGRRVLLKNTFLWASLQRNYATLLYDAGRYDESEVFGQRALKCIRNCSDLDELELIFTLHGLARVCVDLAKYDRARMHYSEVLERLENVPSLPEYYRAVIYNGYGYFLASVDELETAEDYIRKALDIYERVLAPKHPSKAVALYNLGRVCAWSSESRSDEANKYVQEALEMLRSTVGVDHPDFKIVEAGALAFRHIYRKRLQGE